MQEFIGALKRLSILELNEPAKTCKEKFGVSAAAGVVVTGSAANGTAAEKEKSEFDVELTEVGVNEVKVIKTAREITFLGLRETKELVDGAPKMVKADIFREGTETLKKSLEKIGARVTLK